MDAELGHIFNSVAVNPAAPGISPFLARFQNGDPAFSAKRIQDHSVFGTPEIPEDEQLPPKVQNMITQIQEAESTSEKVTLAHQFAGMHIKNQTQDFNEEREVPFAELAHDPHGDCTDYAAFTVGLLQRGGVDPGHIMRITALVEIQKDSGQNITDIHSNVIVYENGDDYLLADNNLADVIPLDPSDPVVYADLTNDDMTSRSPASLEIKHLAIIQDAKGQTYMDPVAASKILEWQNAQQPETQPEPIQPAPPQAETLHMPMIGGGM
ncbi:MAG: transglutaminase-like domain-containing protein [Alphaproteobacteria bacterium]